MTDSALLRRITTDPRIMLGKPVVRGTRITVEFLLDLLSYGSTIDGILEEFPGLKRKDISAAMAYASVAVHAEWKARSPRSPRLGSDRARTL